MYEKEIVQTGQLSFIYRQGDIFSLAMKGIPSLCVCHEFTLCFPVWRIEFSDTLTNAIPIFTDRAVAFTWGHVFGAFLSSTLESQQRASVGFGKHGYLSTRNLLSSFYSM